MSTTSRVVTLSTDGRALRSFPRHFREGNNLAPDQWEASIDAESGNTENLPAAAPDAVAPITARARLLRGIAIARMNGMLNSLLAPNPRATPSQREARFQIALGDAAAAVAANPTDPRALAYQAEVRARHAPAQRAAALATLRGLAQRDVLSDPWSWAQLARLEDNDAARAAALARCTAMAGRNAARACVP